MSLDCNPVWKGVRYLNLGHLRQAIRESLNIKNSEDTKRKTEHIENFMAIYSGFYKSLSEITIADVEFTNNFDSTRILKKRLITNQIDELKYSLSNSIFTSDKMSINRKIDDIHNSKVKRNSDIMLHELKDDGLYTGGQKIISLDIKTGLATFTERGLKQKNIISLLKAVGLTGLQNKAIQNMVNSTTIMNGNMSFFNKAEDLKISARDYLASSILLFYASIDYRLQENTYIALKVKNEKENLEIPLFVKGITYDVLNSVRKRIIPSYRESEFVEYDIITEDKLQNYYESPLKYFSVIKALGEVIFNNKSVAGNNITNSLNKTRALHGVKNSIDTILDTSSFKANGINTHKVLLHVAENGLGSSPLLNNDGTSTNMMINSQKIKTNNKGEIKFEPKGDTPIFRLTDLSEITGARSDYGISENLSKEDDLRASLSFFINNATDANSTAPSSNVAIYLGYNKRKYLVKGEIDQNKNIGGNFYGLSLNSDGRLSDIYFNKRYLTKALEMKFDYYFNEAVISSKKWRELIVNGTLNIDFPALMVNKAEDIDFSKFKNARFNLTPEIEDILKNKLIREKDYYISTYKESTTEKEYNNNINNGNYSIVDTEKGRRYYKKVKKFGFGNAMRFHVHNSTAYTFKNYQKLKSIKDDRNHETIKKREQLIDKMFLVDMKNNLSFFVENMNTQDNFGITEFFKERIPKDYTYVNIAYAKKETESGTKWIVNPFFEMFFYVNHTISSHINPIVFGNDQNSNGVTDYTKRNNPDRTGKMNPSFGHSKGLVKSGKMIIVKSNITSRGIESKNGMTSGFMLHKIAMKYNYGGDTFIQFDNTMYKDLYTGATVETTNKIQNKEAIDYTSSFLIDNFPELEQVQINLLKIYSNTIYNEIDKYNETHEVPIIFDLDIVALYNVIRKKHDVEKSFELLWDQLTDVENNKVYELQGLSYKLSNIIRSSVPKGFTDESTIKVGLTGVNNVDIYSEMDKDTISNITLIDINNENFGLINNPGAMVSEDSTVAIPNQAISHIGVGAWNRNRGISIDNAMMRIQNIGLNELFNKLKVNENVENWEQKDIDLFRDSLRTMGIERTSVIANSSISELLLNGASIDIPQISETLKQLFNNKFNQKVFKPRFNGIKSNQSSSEGMFIFEDSKGNILTYKSLIKKYGRDGVLSAINSGEYTKRELRAMSNNNGIFRPSEVIAPYMYSKKFFINEEDNVSDVFTFSGIDNNGNEVNINLQSLIQKLNEGLVTKNEVISILTESLENISTFEENPAFRYLNSIGMNLDNGITKKHIREIFNYLINFDKSLNIILTRVPFDNPKLGFVGKIVAFSKGNGNTIYIHPDNNERTGGDFDIDQLTVYFNNFNGINIETDTSKMGGNTNEILFEIAEYYKDEKNNISIYGETGTKELENLTQQKESEHKNTYTKPAINTVASIIETNSNMVDGSEAVGIFALSTSAYAYLTTHMTKSTLSKSMYINSKNADNIEEIFSRINNLGKFLQISLDNDKLMLLGRWHIPTALIGTVVSLSIKGYSPEQIYDIFNSEETKYALSSVINEAYRMKNVSVPNTNLAVLTSKILESYIDKKTKLTQKYDKVKLEKEINILNNNIDIYKKIIEQDGADEENTKNLSESIKLRAELNSLFYIDKNIKVLSDFRQSIIESEALKRFGGIVSTRNGIITQSLSRKANTALISLTLGQDMELYNPTIKVSIDDQLEYYKLNSLEYINSKDKDLLLDIEREVRESINIQNILPKYKLFSNNILLINKVNTIFEKSLLSDHPFIKILSNNVAKSINLERLSYKTQHMVIDRMFSNILYSEYFKKQESVDLRTPYLIDDNYVLPNDDGSNYLGNINIGTREGRKIHQKMFIDYFRTIKDLLRDTDVSNDELNHFFNLIGINIDGKPSEVALILDGLRDNKFFETVNISGFEESEILFIDSSINDDKNRVADLNVQFRKLPLSLQEKINMYALIQASEKLNKGSIITILNPDIYSDISSAGLREKLNNISEEELAKMVDYAGMDLSIAQFFNKDKPAKYIKQVKKIKDSFVTKTFLFDGQLDVNGMPNLNEMTRSIIGIGYQLDDETPVYHLNYQRIKLTADEENDLRRNGNNKTSKEFLAGSSYFNGPAVTDSGMVVNISTADGVRLYISKVNDVEAARLKQVERTLNMKLNKNISFHNPIINEKIKNGKDFYLALSNKDSLFNTRLNYHVNSHNSRNENSGIKTISFNYIEDNVTYSFDLTRDSTIITKETADNMYENEEYIDTFDDEVKRKIVFKIFNIKRTTLANNLIKSSINKVIEKPC